MSSSPFIDDFAALAPRFSGGTSATASSIIIYLIFRSKHQLRSIYHRILFCMSLADILSSIGMALTTLAMPRDFPPGVGNENWSGTRIGTLVTCEIQGFVILFGVLTTFMYNLLLCIYYVCVLTFKIQEKTMKRVEPWLHVMAWIKCLIISIYTLHHQVTSSYDAIGFEPWCVISRGSKEGSSRSYITLLVVIIYLIIILICFILMINSVWKTERFIRDQERADATNSDKDCDEADNDNNNKNNVEEGGVDGESITMKRDDHKNTKIVLMLAAAYFGSFLLSLGSYSLRIIFFDGSTWAFRAKLVLLPLQGFFNCVIFIANKICAYRRANSDISVCHALYLLFVGSKGEPTVLISRISAVQSKHCQKYKKKDIDDTSSEPPPEDFNYIGNDNVSSLHQNDGQEQSYWLNYLEQQRANGTTPFLESGISIENEGEGSSSVNDDDRSLFSFEKLMM